MAERNLVQVFISVNSLDNKLASKLEPRASALNEKDVEGIIERAAANGANSIGYTCIRLPHELKQLFREWLDVHYPDKAAHQPHPADERWEGLRQQLRHSYAWAGVFADIIRKRVQVASRKAGLHRAWDTVLDTSQFVAPRIHSPQGELF